MKSEKELISIAEMHQDDNKANAAMKELRERFDKTYFWCQDCDGLVVKQKDCCLNREKYLKIKSEDVYYATKKDLDSIRSKAYKYLL